MMLSSREFEVCVVCNRRPARRYQVPGYRTPVYYFIPAQKKEGEINLIGLVYFHKNLQKIMRFLFSI